MDDARERRGKPCAHRVFPGWAVDLAPVFLLTLAYKLSLENPLASCERRVDAAVHLSQAGVQMVDGQEDDVQSASAGNCGEEELFGRYRLKSGALYGTAARAGAVLCGADPAEAAKVQSAGMTLGLAYQFLDDVADAVAEAGDVGKDTHRDGGKPTAVSLFGVDGARRHSLRLQEEAAAHLAAWGNEADYLRCLIGEASWARE